MSITDVQEEFSQIQDKLNSYLYRLTGSREDAEDLVHDTFIKISEKIDTFRGESGFKTWTFAVATNLAKDLKKVKSRWELNVQDLCKEATLVDKSLQDRIVNEFHNQEEKQFEIIEHINYCFTCVAKNLTLEKQIAIILKEIYDFKRTEIAEILNVTEGVVKHLLHDGRNELQEKYSYRCAMVNKQGVCYQCAELNDFLQEKSDSAEKIAALGLNEKNTAETNLNIRFQLINRINPLTGKGFKVEDTIMQILRETLKE